MPTYEYMCQACGHGWEAVQRMKDDPLRDCPQCGQPHAKRQISAGTGFILKGSGWYADLYSSGSKKSSANGKSDTSNGSSTSSSDSSTASKGDKTEASKAPEKKKEPTKLAGT